MSNFYLKLETYGGVEIDNCCKEACELATKLELTIDFEFNGVTCQAYPNTNWEDLSLNYRDAIGNKVRVAGFKLAGSHPRIKKVE